MYGDGGDDVVEFADALDLSIDNAYGGTGTDILRMNWSEATSKIIYAPYTQPSGNGSGDIAGAPSSYKTGTHYLFFGEFERFELTGGSNDDELVGGDGDDILRGGGGNDTLRSGFGVDVIDGGAGNDHAILKLAHVETIDRAAAASDAGFTLSNGTKLISIESISIQAGDGDDTYDLRGSRPAGQTGPGTFDGGGGNDTNKVDLANSNSSFFDGGNGIDTFIIDWSAATTAVTFFSPIGTVGGHFQYGYRTGPIPGTTSDQFMVDMIAVEKLELTTGSGNDILEGLYEGALLLGQDTINPGLGRDEIDFHSGSDTLVLNWKHVERNIVYGTQSLSYHSLGGSVLAGSLEEGYSGALSFGSDDYLNGTTDRVDFKGVENFNLTLGRGGDSIRTGDGNDTIVGNGGNDYYDTGKGLDNIDGGGGARWQADKSGATVGMTLDLTAPESTYVIAGQTATVTGVSALGHSAANPFKTGSGNDTIVIFDNPRAGNYISTGAGLDTAKLRYGYLKADLGADTDTLVLDWVGNSLRLDGGVTGSSADGYSGFIGAETSFTIFGQTTTTRWGSDFTGVDKFDIRTGLGGGQILTGNGDDVLTGQATRTDGNGQQVAVNAVDEFNGGGGADTLDGGGGLDRLTGGAGADTFRFSTRGSASIDTITDYSFAESDRIDLTPLNQAGSWSPIRPLSSAVKVEQNGSASGLFIDVSSTATPSWEKLADLSGIVAGQQIRVQLGATLATITAVVANSAPTNIGLSNSAVAENSANGTVVGSLSATDPDSGDTFTYSLINSAGGRFAISGANLVTAAPLDFEQAASQAVTIRVTDAAGNTYSKVFTIGVTNQEPDSFTGDARADVSLAGSAGSVMSGGDGADLLVGGPGVDRLAGDGGPDTIVGGGSDDVILGGSGDDIAYGDDGNDVIDLGSGNDAAAGGAGDDVIYGGAGTEYLYGGAGTDTIFGQADTDFLFGEDGNDALYGGDGIDGLSGGAGNDYLFGEAGTDYLYGDAGNDYLYGGDSYDFIYGGEGVDALFGEAGGDLLAGEGGTDYIAGGEGNDYIFGGAGVDFLYGDGGDDTFYGGTGEPDAFYHTAGSGGNDAIMDFEAAGANHDVLVLLGTPYTSREQVLQFAVQDGADTLIYTAADTSVRLVGVSVGQLVPDDLILA